MVGKLTLIKGKKKENLNLASSYIATTQTRMLYALLRFVSCAVFRQGKINGFRLYNVAHVLYINL